MAIEFRCTNCSKLLRTGDDTAGRPAKCPDCGAVMTIPVATGGSGPPPLSSAGGSPFAAGPQPSGPAGSGSPYQSPTFAGQGSAYAAQRVSGPATALIVTAWIGIVLQSLGILAALFLVGAGAGVRPLHAQNPDIFPMMVGGSIRLVTMVVQLAMGVVVLIGAGKMKNLESYGFAMAAAIIALVPCTSPCCLLGLPFGIWALVVLCDSSVKAAFRS